MQSAIWPIRRLETSSITPRPNCATRPATVKSVAIRTSFGLSIRNVADFRLVASREEEHLAGLAERVAPAPVIRVPFLRTDVHDLDGLSEVGNHLLA